MQLTILSAQKLTKILIFLASFLMVLELCNCSFATEKLGYVFDDNNDSNIQKSVTSKQTILNKFGSPTVILDHDDEELWMYMAEEMKHVLFFKPKVVNRKILALEFNQENRVKNFWKLDLQDDTNNFYFDFHKTLVENHKTGFFKGIYENIGTISPR